MKVDVFLFHTRTFIWAPCVLFYQQIDKNPADYFIVWCLLIHTACTPCTYYTYTLYLLHVHLVLTTRTPCTYYMYTLYLLYVHLVLPTCTPCTFYMYTLYLLHVHLVLSTCTPCTYYMYTLYLPSYRWGIIQLVLQLRELVDMTRFVNSYEMTFCLILWPTYVI